MLLFFSLVHDHVFSQELEAHIEVFANLHKVGLPTPVIPDVDGLHHDWTLLGKKIQAKVVSKRIKQNAGSQATRRTWVAPTGERCPTEPTTFCGCTVVPTCSFYSPQALSDAIRRTSVKAHPETAARICIFTPIPHPHAVTHPSGRSYASRTCAHGPSKVSWPR